MATTIDEYVALVALVPLAITSYLFLCFFTTIPALFLPFILFELVALAFLIITPSQYMTAIGLILELTGSTIFAMLYDFEDLRTPIFIVLLTLGAFAFWVPSVYTLLSVRGVKREEMGCLGQMVCGWV